MSRIDTTFDKLKQQQRKALIPFITAGDPSQQLTVPLMHGLVAAGADVLELGVPFSDPLADGPVIQRAMERALAVGTRLKDVVALAGELRAERPKAGRSTSLIFWRWWSRSARFDTGK